MALWKIVNHHNTSHIQRNSGHDLSCWLFGVINVSSCGETECCLYKNCCLVSGSRWCNHFSEIVTMHSKKLSPDHSECCRINLEVSARFSFSSAFRHFSTHLLDSFCAPKCSWIIYKLGVFPLCSDFEMWIGPISFQHSFYNIILK